MLYKSDPMWIKKSLDFAEYTGLSYLIAWGGTFLINLVRAPKLLHDDVMAAQPKQIDVRKGSVVQAFLSECSDAQSGLLRWLINRDEAPISDMPELDDVDVFLKRATDSGIVLYRSIQVERRFGWETNHRYER